MELPHGRDAGSQTLPKNFISKKEYLGTNVLLLWATAVKKSYYCPYWLTFKQAQELQGKVKKGEKATWIIYAATETKEDEKGEPVKYQFLKWYYVFNLEQTEGIPWERPFLRRASTPGAILALRKISVFTRPFKNGSANRYPRRANLPIKH